MRSPRLVLTAACLALSGCFLVPADPGPAPEDGGADAGCTAESSDDACQNGVDDDCDGYVDCGDFSCSRNPQVTVCGGSSTFENTNAACSDGVDNDGDGFVDCKDYSCSRNPAVTACACVPTGTENTGADCMDGIDNDCNGYTDCKDRSCVKATPCCPDPSPEGTNDTCSDGIDNDCNGYTDCKDFACSRNSAVTVCGTTTTCTVTGAENTAAACGNGKDDDCNGKVDCADPACKGSSACPSGTKAACGTCTANADCASGVCLHFTAYPSVSFCSQSCTTTTGCPSTMKCNASGSCVPILKAACTSSTASALTDGCGHTYATTTCATGQSCVMSGASPVCQKPGLNLGDCALCTKGSDCSSGLCLRYGAETTGYCSRTCTVAVDCPDPFDSCLTGYCEARFQNVTKVCSADGKQVLTMNVCGAVLDRTQCQGSDECGHSKPTVNYPLGSTLCLDKCYWLNGTTCGGGYCESCYYTYSSTTGKCCGQCNGVSDCTYP